MKAALIDATGTVVNMIVVDSLSDPVPAGQTLVDIEGVRGVNKQCTWTQQDGFKMSAAEQAEKDAEISALEALAYAVG